MGSWVPSTVANIGVLIGDARKALAANDGISLPFMAYQIAMLFSTLVGPATVLLVMIGGLNYGLHLPLAMLEGVMISVALFYIGICLFAAKDTQLVIGKILTMSFALVMGAVAYGIAAQIADESAKYHRHEPNTTIATTPAAPHPTWTPAHNHSSVGTPSTPVPSTTPPKDFEDLLKCVALLRRPLV